MYQIFTEKLLEIKENIQNTAIEYGRTDIMLPEIVAVSKNIDVEKIKPLLETGHKIFAENRVQEAMIKWPPLRKLFPGIELHLIGPLQTNKAKDALGLFEVIQTLDREKLARFFAKERAGETDSGCRTHSFFVQVNIAQEPQKSGVALNEASDFISFCSKELNLPVKGLMCIPPRDEEPSPYFAALATLAREQNLPYLSMGMSDDYAVAAALGATHIRLGTALFVSGSNNNYSLLNKKLTFFFYYNRLAQPIG